MNKAHLGLVCTLAINTNVITSVVVDTDFKHIQQLDGELKPS